MLKMIFHIDEIDRWPMVLKNVRNSLVAEPESMIEVLANGGAVVFFMIHTKTLESDWLDLVNKGVSFKACRNALNEHQIREDSLPKVVEVVPAGTIELAKKQMEGFSYIRP